MKENKNMSYKIKSKPARESFVETNEIVLPSHANALGTIFGGILMSWIDIAAAISAQRYSERICVTAGVDALHFLAPVHVGDTVNLKAKVVHTGTTSMIVFVEVNSENPLTGIKRQCVKAHVSMVALNEERRPTAIPPLRLSTLAEKRAFQIAAERRKFLLRELKGRRGTKDA
jgi:acyl-CoA hydrolase